MLVSLLSILIAQPEPPAEHPSEPASYLAEFCRTYQSEGVADRVHLTAYDAEDEGRSLEVVLRRSQAGEETVTRIDFPEVSLYHTHGVLTAERAGEGTKAVVYQDEDVGGFVDALAGVMPLWPMPQLWSIEADGSVIDPALGRLTFTHAAMQEHDVILTGSSLIGDVTLVIDAESHRAVWFEADLRDGRIRCDYRRVQRENPASWAISTEGRWIVSQLEQLTLSGPPLAVGHRFNDLDLITPDFKGISLSELQGMEQVRRAGPWVVLLVVDSEATQTTFDLTREIAAGLWTRSAQEIAALNTDDVRRYWLGHRTFVIAVSPDLGILPDKVASIAERAPIGVPFLISTEPEHTLDRFTSDLPIVAVLVDPHRTVGAVIPIETAETGISAVHDAMRSYTRSDVTEEPAEPVLGSE